MTRRPGEASSDGAAEVGAANVHGAAETAVPDSECRPLRGAVPVQRRASSTTANERAGLDDRALLAAYTAGDDRAFDEIVSRHWGRLLRSARAIVRNHDDAEDALQVGLTRAATNAHKFRGDSSVKNCMNLIVSNAAIDGVMKSRREVQLDAAALAELEAQRAPDAAMELGLAVESGLQALPREQRDAWVLVCQLGFTQREAAELMAAPHGTVKSWVARSKTSLANHIFGTQ